MILTRAEKFAMMEASSANREIFTKAMKRSKGTAKGNQTKAARRAAAELGLPTPPPTKTRTKRKNNPRMSKDSSGKFHTPSTKLPEPYFHQTRAAREASELVSEAFGRPNFDTFVHSGGIDK